MSISASADQTATPGRDPAGDGDPGLVTVRFWAGARAAAGTAEETYAASTVAGVLAAAVARHPDLAPIAPLCTVLAEGRSLDREAVLAAGTRIELLPPFAGG